MYYSIRYNKKEKLNKGAVILIFIEK